MIAKIQESGKLKIEVCQINIFLVFAKKCEKEKKYMDNTVNEFSEMRTDRQDEQEMGKKNKSKNTQNANENNTEQNAQIVSRSTIHLLEWVLGISIPAFITVIGFIAANLYSLNATVSSLSVKMDEMDSKIEDINTKVENMQNEIRGENGIYSRLTAIETKLDIQVVEASSNMVSYLNKADIEKNSSEITTAATIDPNAVIGTDAEGNVYIADELINQTIILTYNGEGKEVYFLGQYDENYKWNGYCVTNAYYPDGSLYGICESNFDDGIRLDYKSFVATDVPNEWIYSNKTCNEASNAGENILYSMDYNQTKNFTTTNVRVTDIMYPDDFVNQNNPHMQKYYNGNTVDGKYEDNTGNAYYISFDENGTVKTLYIGRFANGNFNDDTGEAWEISYSEDYETYVYNRGSFKDGGFVGGDSKQVDAEGINELVSGYTFNCQLEWKCTVDKK